MTNYAVTDDQVVFRIPEYNELTQYAPGQYITLEVSENCGTEVSEVSVTGVGHWADETSAMDQTVDLRECWPPEVITRILRLDLTDIHGSTRGNQFDSAG
jgi:hypothetical protein